MSDEPIIVVLIAMLFVIGILVGGGIVNDIADEREQHLITYINTIEKYEIHVLDEVNATLSPDEIIAWGETTKIRVEYRR